MGIRKVASDIMKKRRNGTEGSKWYLDYYLRNKGSRLQETVKAKNVAKADSPVESTTGGVFNAVYGSELWGQFNTSATGWGMLPKDAWSKSGWRVLTARANTTDYGAVPESGSVPESIKPDFGEIDADIKTVAHVGEASQVQQILANSEDDAVGSIADVQAYIAEQHERDLSGQLFDPIQNDTGNQMTSLDKIVSANSTEVSNNGSIDAGDAEVFGIDRSSASWSESVVLENGGTNRTLTDGLINDLIADVNNNVGNKVGNRFWVTGTDTLSEIRQLYSDQVRYNGPFQEDTVNISVNGVEAVNGDQGGQNAGFRVQSLCGYPIVVSDQVPAAPQADALSKLFMLDTGDPENHGKPRLGIDVAQPTSVYEAGLGTANNNPFITDKFSGKILVQSLGELKCRRFDAQGKITDIEAS
mgnify:CR=1 FL=1